MSIDLLDVSQFNKVLWFWRLALGISRVFSNRSVALVQWPCGSGSDRLFGVSNYSCRSDLGRQQKADAGRDCRNRNARPNSQARTRIKPYAPGSDRSYSCRSNLGRYKKKLTLNGTAETVSRDQILRRARE